MVRIALAPCSPFSVTPQLMVRTAELAERLDVRLHTHLAEDPDEDAFADARFGKRTIEHFEDVGWCTDRSWVAHCIYPNDAEIARLGAAGVGVAHCPSSNMMIGGGGIAPVPELRAAGVPVGLGCDGSSSDRLGLAVDGGPQRHAPRAPAGRAGSRPAPATPSSWPPEAAPAASVAARAGPALARRGWRPRGLAARRRPRSPVPSPTRSRRGCAAARSPPATPWSPAGSWCATAGSRATTSTRCSAATAASPNASSDLTRVEPPWACSTRVSSGGEEGFAARAWSWTSRGRGPERGGSEVR